MFMYTLRRTHTHKRTGSLTAQCFGRLRLFLYKTAPVMLTTQRGKGTGSYKRWGVNEEEREGWCEWMRERERERLERHKLSYEK